MDGSAFRYLSFGWLMPMFVLALIGAASLLAGAGFGLYFLVSHIHWG